MVLDILHKHLPADVKVWVFGSRADWTTKDSSDLDLALEGDIDHDTILALEMAFEESSLPYTVDVVDLNHVTDSFRSIVEAQRMLLLDWHTSNDEKVRLRDVAELIMGQSPPGSTYNKTGLGLAFFQGVKDFNYRHPSPNIFCSAPSRIARSGDILFSVRAPIGRVNIADTKCAIGRGLAIIRCDNLVDAHYMEFLLRSMKPIWDMMDAGGTVFGSATKKDLESLVIRWPSIQERRTVSHMLRTLDDKIELNRRMNQTLEEMARTLFKSWFVDFDPVRAKMNNTWKRGESLPGLPAHLYDVFPDRLVDSELGEIPERWEVKPLDEIADFRNGLALQNYRPANNESRLPVVKIAQLRNGRVDGKEWAKEDITPECIIDDGDVIFSWSGSLLVKVWCGGRAALNQHLFKVTSVKYPKWFFLSWVEQHLKKFQDIATDKATTMGHIRRHHLREVNCIVPDKIFLNTSNSILESLLIKQILNNVQSRSLVNIRDTLLPKLISGKLRVSPTIHRRKK